VLSLVCFFTIRAKSRPDMRNPEVFCNKCWWLCVLTLQMTSLLNFSTQGGWMKFLV
jgi:hypothetical protein